MEVETKIEGLDDVLRRMKLLKGRTIRNASRRALRKGANIIRDAARENAKRLDDPETARRIWKNIAVSGGGSKREKAAGGPVMRVGVRGGARYNPAGDGLPGGNTTGMWRFVEFGTSKAPAQPFMRWALAHNAAKAIAAFVADLPKQLEDEIAKIR